MDFIDFPIEAVNWPVQTVAGQLKQLNWPVQTVQTVGFSTVSTVSTDSVQIRSNPLLFLD